jgi:hypothetical protein
MATPTAKAALVNVATSGILRFHFTPTSLMANIAAVYGRAASLGGTGQRLHFGHTTNFQINTTVYMDKHALVGRNPDAGAFLADVMMREVQKFLLAAVFPVGRQNDPIRRAPPRLLFIWPGIMELPVRMMTQKFNFTKFEKRDLLPWIYSVPITMESDLSATRITSDVIAVRGFQLAGYGA